MLFRQQTGDAEVDQLDLVSLRMDQDVGGFDVFVDDALLAEIMQGVGQLQGNGEKFTEEFIAIAPMLLPVIGEYDRATIGHNQGIAITPTFQSQGPHNRGMFQVTSDCILVAEPQ